MVERASPNLLRPGYEWGIIEEVPFAGRRKGSRGLLAVVVIHPLRLAVRVAVSVRFPRTGWLIAPAMAYLALTGLRFRIIFGQFFHGFELSFSYFVFVQTN